MNLTKANELYNDLEEILDSSSAVIKLPFVKRTAIALMVGWLVVKAASTATLTRLITECKALGKEMGRSWFSVFLMQCVYDILQRQVDLVASACTVGSAGPYFIRYMDWGVPEGIGKYAEKTVLTAADGSKFTSIGFAGFLGCITAYGDKWALAMNQSPVAGGDISGVPACYYTRMFAEQLAPLVEANTHLDVAIEHILDVFEVENIHPMSSINLIVRDAHHHAVIEFLPGKRQPVVEVHSITKAIAVANHMYSIDNADLNPEQEEADALGDVWGNDTYERQEEMLALVKRLVRRKAVNLDKLIEEIDDPIKNDLTAYAVLINFNTAETLVMTE